MKALAAHNPLRKTPGLGWAGAILAAALLNFLFFAFMPGLTAQAPDLTLPRPVQDPVRITEYAPPDASPPPQPPKQAVQPPGEAPKTMAPRAAMPPSAPMPDLSPAPLDLASSPPMAFPALPAPRFEPVALPPEAFEGPFEETAVDTRPTDISSPRPAYPLRAHRLGIEGTVVVRFTVTREGRVADAEIIQAEPENVFEENTLAAVASWRLAPGAKNGRAVDTRVTRTIHFRLEE